jgi:hypothetical protein
MNDAKNIQGYQISLRWTWDGEIECLEQPRVHTRDCFQAGCLGVALCTPTSSTIYVYCQANYGIKYSSTDQDKFKGVIDKILRRHQISKLKHATKLYFNMVVCLEYLFDLLRQFF